MVNATLYEGGIRVYETNRYSLVGEDRDYSKNILGADFDVAGRVVTACDDGFVRLYERGANGALRKVAEQKAAGEKDEPCSVSFSPDGARVAVGFDNSNKVVVLSGRNLTQLYAPNAGGVVNGALCSVAWSADGRILWAGGRYDKQGKYQICQWEESGRGQYREITAASNTIYQIFPLRHGGIIYGAADPAWGVIDISGQRTYFSRSAIADYRGMLESFLVSGDGMIVQFGYDAFAKSTMRFACANRQLDEPTSGSSSLQPPRTKGLAINDWNDSDSPKLNEQMLRLDDYERSYSLAIAPDRSRFLLGTDYWLRLYDQGGAALWQIRIPSVAWSVNISGNGKLAVAAFGDGMIRWYRMTDGKELLAFFPHNDRKRWVLWTPQGYYDASPGAEELIGWHVNNGKDQAADFFPVSKLRSTYYRPDVISRVLTVGDEAEALRLADAEAGRKRQEAEVLNRLPPVVEIISPADGAEVSAAAVTVRYALRAPSGEPVAAVKALVDGRPVALDRKLVQVKSEAQQLSVTIPERDCELALIAENKFAASVPAVVRLKWRGRAVAEEFVIKPKLYVLAVGVSRYANAEYNLGFPAKDARDFADVMRRQQGVLYREVAVKLLVDDKATRDEVVDGLDWIRQQTTAKDVAMVFLAGHGVNDAIGRYFFCPYNIDPDKMLRTGVAFSDIKSAVESLAGKTVFFVDTCYSGNVLGGSSRSLTRLTLFDINGFINELTSAENGAVVFAASTGKQVSLENQTWNNGAFTKALVEGLGGAADYTKKGKITINSLDLYLAERVKELTRGRQTPTTTKPVTVPDFPIALKQ